MTGLQRLTALALFCSSQLVAAAQDDGSMGCLAMSNALLKDMPNLSTDEANRRMQEAQACLDEVAKKRAAVIPEVKSAGNCPTTLSYLDLKLPRYPGDKDYTNIRTMAVQTNLVEALGKARQQGLSPSDAADQALQQAKAAEATERAMADVARAYNNAGEATLARLKNGTYQESGQLPVAFEGYLVAYVAAVVSKEAAAGVACIARRQGK